MKLSNFAQAYEKDLMARPQWVSGFALKAANELERVGMGKVTVEGSDFDPEPYFFTPREKR